MTARFEVFARDVDLSKLGTINGYTDLTCTPRFNAVGSWSLTYPVGSLGATLLAAGRGVRIFRKGEPKPIMTGPVTNLEETLGADRKTPQVKFTGACDNLWLARRLALPDPATDGDTYADAYDTRTGDYETVMHGYVDANAGPGALFYRRVPGLVLGPNLHRGGFSSYSARFESLLVALQNLGAPSGLGFQVQQEGSQLVFTVYQPQDLRKLVRFSASTRSLGAYGYSLGGPTATAAYVGDGAPAEGRSFSRFVDSDVEADWGRSEIFVDQSGATDATQIAQAGSQALAAGGPQAQVTFEPRDTPQHRYGSDFGLGDTVTVRVRLGDVADVVREVTITDSSSDGIKVRPTVGGTQASDPNSTPAIYRALSTLARSVGYLQRRL